MPRPLTESATAAPRVDDLKRADALTSVDQSLTSQDEVRAVANESGALGINFT
jgi:hypothetical protein